MMWSGTHTHTQGSDEATQSAGNELVHADVCMHRLTDGSTLLNTDDDVHDICFYTCYSKTITCIKCFTNLSR